jgi:hypothetical protein
MDEVDENDSEYVAGDDAPPIVRDFTVK